MNTLLYFGLIYICAMIIILTLYSEDLIKKQKEIRDSFIKKRKKSLYKITLTTGINEELIKDINKGFFTKKRESIERLIYRSEVKITYFEFLAISLFSGFIGWFLGDFLNNFIICIVLAVLFYYLPKIYLQFICDSVRAQINEQLEPALSQIIGLLPTKKTLVNACEACITNIDEPLKVFFTEFINNINNANRSFEESITDLARKIDTKPFNDFARLAIVHYKQGGDTVYAFSSIPETLRDIKMVQSEQESELDSLKLLGYMFTALAPFCYLYYYFTDKNNFGILTNSMAGKVISIIVLVITVVTILLVRKISKPVEL